MCSMRSVATEPESGMIVLDTSAVVEVLVNPERPPPLVERLAGAGSLHAPHLLDTEVVAALRRLALGGVISEDRATDALRDFSRLAMTRYPAAPMLLEIWDLRSRMTAYDATFLALAEALRCPLVTCDARMARAGTSQRVEAF